MANKRAPFTIKGMSRDLAVSKFDSKYAYENMNIRLTSSGDNELLVLTNEKGTADTGITVSGTVLGQCIINDILVVFSKSGSTDYITKIYYNGTTLTKLVLFHGDLNFNLEHPIECISSYENEYIQKVYWTDHYNQPRVINVAVTSEYVNGDIFNFVRNIDTSNLKVEISQQATGGYFAPGTIQYYATMYNRYGQETNVFYTSPLYYTAGVNKGLSTDKYSSNAFELVFKSLDYNFEYLRVYSVLRTSKDATPQVRRVADIPVELALITNFEVQDLDEYTITFWNSDGESTIYEEPEEDDFDFYDCVKIAVKSNYQDHPTTIHYYTTTPVRVYTYHTSSASLKIVSDVQNALYREITKSLYDTGTIGDAIDPTELLYVGGEEITVGTLEQKDGVLFLGNVAKKTPYLTSSFKSTIKNGATVTVVSKPRSISEDRAYRAYYEHNSQLDSNSRDIKIFKKGEYYRLGLQFQTKNGRWSDVAWIGDYQNTSSINGQYFGSFSLSLNSTAITAIENAGFVNVRPLVVYPDINDREVICQGVVCPTVYNVKNRSRNAPYVQSSWFIRPESPFSAETFCADSSRAIPNGQVPLVPGDNLSNRYCVMSNYDLHSQNGIAYNISQFGKWAEFRHNSPIPNNNKPNSEIQCICNAPDYPTIDMDAEEQTDFDTAKEDWVEEHSDNFFIDKSIVTMHSPDVEFDDMLKNLDLSNYKFRIVGYVPIHSSYSEFNIVNDTPPSNYISNNADNPITYYDSIAPGMYHRIASAKSKSVHGWKSMLSGVYWLDEANLGDSINDSLKNTGFVVYPWHRKGALNNSRWEASSVRTSMLKSKVMSILRYSCNTVYLSSSTAIPTQVPKLFNSDDVTLTGLNYGDNRFNYFGNVDSVITLHTKKTGVNIDCDLDTIDRESNGTVRPSDLKSYGTGYPIIISDVNDTRKRSLDKEELFNGTYGKLVGFTETSSGAFNLSWVYKYDRRDSDHFSPAFGNDPIPMRYKSTPHIVVPFSNNGNDQTILPRMTNGDNQSKTLDTDNYFFWDNTLSGVRQDVINVSDNIYGYLWLAEIYNDEVINRFGGTSEEALEGNDWHTAGNEVSLFNLKSGNAIEYREGDTYYQRYDCLKTAPFADGDVNSIVDIVSFMCETRINIDGRYDNNRGLLDNTNVDKTSFNLINTAYTQDDNFVGKTFISADRKLPTSYPNIVSWTKAKSNGADVDTWTNLTLASTLELDGDRGTLNAIRRNNNDLVAFQDSGISKILYNESAPITTTTGMPLELANSNRVQGKRYISSTVGCRNKWSIATTPYGLLFVDDNIGDIYSYGEQLSNLSEKLGMHSWVLANAGNKPWNPYSYNNIVSKYDKTTGDVLFITNDTALAYSTILGVFTSFYNYERLGALGVINDKSLSVKNGKVWLNRGGDFNKFFNVSKSYSTTVIVNPDPTEDKIFNTVEFRADSFDSTGAYLPTTTFNKLYSWNEYQTGNRNLIFNNTRHGNLKKKFRIWRADIPRSIETLGRDRMRNPWLFIKLEDNRGMNIKTVIHDITVDYFE